MRARAGALNTLQRVAEAHQGDICRMFPLVCEPGHPAGGAGGGETGFQVPAPKRGLRAVHGPDYIRSTAHTFGNVSWATPQNLSLTAGERFSRYRAMRRSPVRLGK